MINTLFNLQLSESQKINYAAQLGSDCPFFVINQPCHASGRGEMLSPISCDLTPYQIVLIHPGIHVSTAWAFSQLVPHTKEKSIATIIQTPIENWKANLINDFEKPVFEAHPLLKEIKQNLYEQGALYASMSGSGSSLFGIFTKEKFYHLPSHFGNLRVDRI
jgi:4-diphosphocytidyl-2-C-methyl-D-erythritol kinase